MSRDLHMPLGFDEIEVPEGRRKLNPAVVKKLAESIDKIGLRHPITVRKHRDRYILVAGLHRMEACRKLGREHVPALITTFTNADARLWEISENLHRAELTKIERDENIAEWIRIVEEEVSAQHGQKPQGGRPEGGISAAARELGISRQDAERAVKVDSLSDEAKEAAHEHGLDDNRAALLKAADEPTSDAQVAKIVQLSQPKAKDGPSEWREAFTRLWDRASAADREWARSVGMQEAS